MGEELNNSFCRLQTFDLDGLEEAEATRARWLDNVQQELNCAEEFELKARKFAGPNKPVLAKWLEEATEIICQQREFLCNMKEMVELLKTEALGDKRNVIKLQTELLECKDKQLQSLQTAVETTVQASVQKEIQTYSSVVAKSSSSSATVCTQQSLKNAVKTAIKEDDRSRNVMVFGLPEEEGEQLDEKVGELFSELGEKPRVAASRVGRSPDGRAAGRPVKVALSSATSVQQILLKARRLKLIESRKSVYICPDRSHEERTARKKVVLDLRKAVNEQPELEHFIRNGKLCSKAKT